jgi:hypothetical protein
MSKEKFQAKLIDLWWTLAESPVRWSNKVQWKMMDNWNDSEKTTSRFSLIQSRKIIKATYDTGDKWREWHPRQKKFQMPKGTGYIHGYTFWESSKCSRQSGQNLVNLICVGSMFYMISEMIFSLNVNWSDTSPFQLFVFGASRVLTILWMSARCSKIQAGIKKLRINV